MYYSLDVNHAQLRALMASTILSGLVLRDRDGLNDEFLVQHAVYLTDTMIERINHGTGTE